MFLLFLQFLLYVLTCLFVVCEQVTGLISDTEVGGDLPLKLGVNAGLKISANNEGERDDDKKPRVENIV